MSPIKDTALNEQIKLWHLIIAAGSIIVSLVGGLVTVTDRISRVESILENHEARIGVFEVYGMESIKGIEQIKANQEFMQKSIDKNTSAISKFQDNILSFYKDYDLTKKSK